MTVAKKSGGRRTPKGKPAGGGLPVTAEFAASDEFMALSDADKERVWESFNREIPFKETKPLSPRQRELWKRAKGKAGRPKVGSGAKVISLSVEKGLLDRADAYAKATGLSRARQVAMGLEAVLSAKGRDRRTP